LYSQPKELKLSAILQEKPHHFDAKNTFLNNFFADSSFT